jgi:2-keto-4-pentenoate hydratase/2-oxohepta-3-ene-1,7-dioic acid hydratase in catechol pathway
LRLCTFEAGGREAPGRIEGDRVVELGAPSLVAWLVDGGEDVGDHALGDVRLRAPVPHPPSVRDFYAFERHVATARAQRGLEMAPEWYRIPVFYFSNPAAVLGPDDEVRFPPESSAWDYELEAAVVVDGDGASQASPC